MRGIRSLSWRTQYLRSYIKCNQKLQQCLTAIFLWNNCLDEYIGHFGVFYYDLKEYCRLYGQVRKVRKFTCWHNKICNGASVLRDWLKQWLKDHSEHQNNNNGVMMRLKWEFTREFASTMYVYFNYWDTLAIW